MVSNLKKIYISSSIFGGIFFLNGCHPCSFYTCHDEERIENIEALDLPIILIKAKLSESGEIYFYPPPEVSFGSLNIINFSIILDDRAKNDVFWRIEKNHRLTDSEKNEIQNFPLQYGKEKTKLFSSTKTSRSLINGTYLIKGFVIAHDGVSLKQMRIEGKFSYKNNILINIDN